MEPDSGRVQQVAGEVGMIHVVAVRADGFVDW